MPTGLADFSDDEERDKFSILFFAIPTESETLQSYARLWDARTGSPPHPKQVDYNWLHGNARRPRDRKGRLHVTDLLASVRASTEPNSDLATVTSIHPDTERRTASGGARVFANQGGDSVELLSVAPPPTSWSEWAWRVMADKSDLRHVLVSLGLFVGLALTPIVGAAAIVGGTTVAGWVGAIVGAVAGVGGGIAGLRRWITRRRANTTTSVTPAEGNTEESVG